MIGPPRTRAGVPLLLVLALLVPMVLAGLLAPPAHAATSRLVAAEPDAPPGITVQSTTPTTIGPTSGVTISGRIRNTGTAEIANPVVRLWLAEGNLRTRERVASWTGATGSSDRGEQVGQLGLNRSIAPGADQEFTLSVPSSDLPTLAATLGSLPVTLTVTDGSAPGAASRAELRLALPYSNATTAPTTRLGLGWVVPLTLPADPALFGPSGPERLAAWRRAIGPGSRIDRLLTRLEGTPVTWLVDPTILQGSLPADSRLPAASGTPQDGATGEPTAGASDSPTGDAPSTSTSAEASASPSPSTSPGPSPSSSPSSTQAPDTTSVEAMVTALRDRLTERADSQPVSYLPAGDPDQLGLLRAGGKQALEQYQSRATAPGTRDEKARTLQWPIADPTARELRTISAVARAQEDTTPTTLLSTRQLDGGARPQTGQAGRRFADGTLILSYDDQLSATAGAQKRARTGSQVQTFLADTLAMYLQAPGRQRSATVVLPRNDQATPEQIRAVIDAAAKAPWLTQTPVSTLLAAAPQEATDTRMPTGLPVAAVPTQRSPLTASALADTERSRTVIAAMSTILVDSQDVVTGWDGLLDELGSTRWRGAPVGYRMTAQELNEAAQEIPTNIEVHGTPINVFTDEVRISVTVENRLNRAVRDVHLQLTPRRRLVDILEQPRPLSLSADSRSTIRVPVRAVSSGRVRLEAQLSTPAGTPLGPPQSEAEQFALNVRPTDTWLYWALGIVAGPILVIGLWRALSRGPRDPHELDPEHTPTRESDDD